MLSHYCSSYGVINVLIKICRFLTARVKNKKESPKQMRSSSSSHLPPAYPPQPPAFQSPLVSCQLYKNALFWPSPKEWFPDQAIVWHLIRGAGRLFIHTQIDIMIHLFIQLLSKHVLNVFLALGTTLVTRKILTSPT